MSLRNTDGCSLVSYKDILPIALSCVKGGISLLFSLPMSLTAPLLGKVAWEVLRGSVSDLTQSHTQQYQPKH
jgi:hypothetical protein